MRMADCHPDQRHYAKGLCKQCYGIAYYAANREERLTYKALHKIEYATYHAAYYITHREKHRAWAATRNAALRREAITAYGGPVCACCGETLYEGLSIDHINGGGTVQRRECNNNFYEWLKKNNYPPGYQVLCMTCNVAKGTSDRCPHQDKG